MTARDPPLLVDVVGLVLLSGMRFLLVSRGATTKKKKQSKKSTSTCAPEHVLWSVCTPYWTLGPVVGTPAEGMCVTPRLWPELVDLVGIKSLSGTRF